MSTNNSRPRYPNCHNHNHVDLAEYIIRHGTPYGHTVLRHLTYGSKSYSYLRIRWGRLVVSLGEHYLTIATKGPGFYVILPRGHSDAKSLVTQFLTRFKDPYHYHYAAHKVRPIQVHQFMDGYYAGTMYHRRV